MTKTKIYIAALVITVAIIGGYFYPKAPKQQPQISVGAIGDVNTSARIAQCSLDMSTTSPTLATSTGATGCLFNGDGRDRIISSVEFYAAGLGTMVNGTIGATGTSTLVISTSTTAFYPNSANSVLSMGLATTTNGTTALPTLYFATTSPGIVGVGTTVSYGAPIINSFARIWATGTYLASYMNATSSAGTGTVVIKYFVAP